MSPLIQGKLLDLLVNFVAIILGGGLITLVIELRRHQRERLNWQREDEMVQIDIPRSDLRCLTWIITDKTSDKDKLVIYENILEGTIRKIFVVAEFVIRNTTAAEIIITHYDADVLQIPSGNDTKHFYDLETHDLISVDDIGAVRLRPYSTIPRVLVLVCEFDKDRKLESLPTTLVISAKTSSGKILQGKATLNLVNRIPDLEYFRDEYHLKKYADKVRTPEDELPF